MKGCFTSVFVGTTAAALVLLSPHECHAQSPTDQTKLTSDNQPYSNYTLAVTLPNGAYAELCMAQEEASTPNGYVPCACKGTAPDTFYFEHMRPQFETATSAGTNKWTVVWGLI